MVESLLAILAAGLSLWNSKEKTKYVDRLTTLKKAYYEEYNKKLEDRSDAVLDNLEFELRLLGRAFASSVGDANTQNKS